MWKNTTQAIYQVESSFKNAEKYKSKLIPEILDMEGMTGKKTKHLYNNLMNTCHKINFLEIGSWRGSSFVSSMYNNNNVYGIAVDDFNPNYGGPNAGIDNYSIMKQNCEKFLTEKQKYEIKVKEFYELNVNELPKIDVYLYDGDHIDHFQYNAFKKMHPCFADICIVVIDDYNATGVQNGTTLAKREFGKEIPFNIVHEKVITYTTDGSHTPIDIAKEEYWNGIYVCVLEKINEVK